MRFILAAEKTSPSIVTSWVINAFGRSIDRRHLSHSSILGTAISLAAGVAVLNVIRIPMAGLLPPFRILSLMVNSRFGRRGVTETESTPTQGRSSDNRDFADSEVDRKSTRLNSSH